MGELVDVVTFRISGLCRFAWANKPLIEVFTPADAHHLLLQAEVSLCHYRLQLSLTAHVAELVLRRISRCVGVGRVLFYRLPLWLIDLFLRHLAWALTSRVRWLIVVTSILNHLILKLLLDLFLLGKTEGAGSPLEWELEGRLLYFNTILLISFTARRLSKLRRWEWWWGSSLTDKDATKAGHDHLFAWSGIRRRHCNRRCIVLLDDLLWALLVLRGWLDFIRRCRRIIRLNSLRYGSYTWDCLSLPARTRFIGLLDSLDIFHNAMASHFLRELALWLLFTKHGCLTFQLVQLDPWLSWVCLWCES